MGKIRMGKWELICLIINSLIYKVFTGFIKLPTFIGGSGGWISALLSGIIFLLLLGIVLKIYEPYSDIGIYEAIKKKRPILAKLILLLAIIYFLLSAVYALYLICDALKIIAYENSPYWFIGFFLCLAAIIVLLLGKGAVGRLHSLFAFGGAVSILLICLLSLAHADVYNLTPILGKGTFSILKASFLTLFLYSDIVILFFLPKEKQNYSFSKTVFLGAKIAVFINIFASIAMSLSVPYEIADKLSLPFYPLTKIANLGKFPIRLDVTYLFSVITSGVLYLSLCFNIIKKNIKNLPKKATTAAVCILLCFTLCGCFDASEAEERGYIIALGIDKGDESKYRYTFQISNPLSKGESYGTGSESKNKTVDNIVVEADNFSVAEDKLKSILSKKADMSHLKLIAYSKETAEDDAITHSELLLYEREVRPATNLCLCENASDFLLSVKPSLEESTVRYYELFFRNYDTVFAPVSELRDFVGRSRNLAYDAVVPIVLDNSLLGMGVFSDGVLKAEMNEEEAAIFKLLCGDLKKGSINEKIESVSNKGKPKIKIYENKILIKLKIKEDLNSKYLLEDMCEDFLYKVSALKCDVLGLGRYLKKECLTQKQWEEINFKEKLPNYEFSVDISI